LVKHKEHLTIEGIKKLVAIKASINLGLSDKLKAAFLDVKPVKKPLVINQEIKNPYWIAGFIDGEGCFLLKLKNLQLTN